MVALTTTQDKERALMFGPCHRYAVQPHWQHYDVVKWVVFDAEHPESERTSVEIRRADTFMEAVAGLISDDELSELEYLKNKSEQEK